MTIVIINVVVKRPINVQIHLDDMVQMVWCLIAVNKNQDRETRNVVRSHPTPDWANMMACK